MTRTSGFAAFSTVLFLLAAVPAASGDPITITGGSLDMTNQLGRLTLNGDRGFTLTGFVSASGGIFEPQLQCNIAGCSPGTSIDLGARWIGNDLAATVTLDGQTFRNVGSLAGDTSAGVNFAGSATAPPLGGSGVVQAPFTFDGFFSTLDARVPLIGSGIASLRLRPDVADGGWTVVETTYDFGAASAVTPEPTAVGLFGGGLLVAAAIIRRRLRF